MPPAEGTRLREMGVPGDRGRSTPSNPARSARAVDASGVLRDAARRLVKVNGLSPPSERTKFPLLDAHSSESVSGVTGGSSVTGASPPFRCRRNQLYIWRRLS